MKNLNKRKIISLTKIKEPFLMIDNVKKIIPLKSGVGAKKINKKLWFFKCHFTDKPMMPGSLIQESMLQTVVSILYSSKKFDKKICLIISAKTNFFSKVCEKTVLKINVKITKITKTKVEAISDVYNSNGLKIANGLFKYFITYKINSK